jgi:arginine-tRNA-protein transferase
MLGLRYLDDPHPCAYLPGRVARLEHELSLDLTPTDYAAKREEGYRRFGLDLFRPACAGCSACRPLRVDVARFRPDRSQRRCRALNRDAIRFQIGEPTASPAVLTLSRRFHEARSREKGWPDFERDADSHRSAFVSGPFPAQEWRYFLDDDLVGVGYVDDLPTGLSAIYFLHEPALRGRSLGTFNVLSLIDEAARRGLPHVYLGYHVEGCESLEYKARFRPNEVLGEDGRWRPYRGES